MPTVTTPADSPSVVPRLEPRWVRAPAPTADHDLTSQHVDSRLVDLLRRRGVTRASEADAFLAPRIDALHPWSEMAGIAEALELFDRVRNTAGTVWIVGDYDVDGVSSLALLRATLEACGVAVRTVVPHRMRDGYGIQTAHVEQAVAEGASLLVTVDCGTTAHAALEAARAADLPVVVVDHHLPGAPLPDGVVLVNPKQEGCRYPFEELCAAGLSFKLALALCERWDRELSVEGLLRIACLGTIADMVPLQGENRVIAALGLQALGDTRSRGLRRLFEVAGVQPPVASDDVGFRIGPRLNAAGRLDTAELALELLLTRDGERAAVLARRLDELNGRRKQEEERVVTAAIERFEEQATEGLPGILVAWDEGWHRGVVGIAASRVARRFHRPSLLLAVEGDTATGSGRSVPGVHLHRFLSGWSDRLVRFGGHAQAIGLTAATDELEELVDAWRAAAAESFDREALTPVREYEMELSPAECDLDLWRQLRRLEPHGQGNPQPLLRVGPMRLAEEPRIFAERHLRAEARGEDGGRLSLLGWRWAARRQALDGAFEALGYLERDRRYGQLELRLVEARSHSA